MIGKVRAKGHPMQQRKSVRFRPFSRNAGLLACAALALGGCSGSSDPAPSDQISQSAPDATPASALTSAPRATTAAPAIPQALRGRWGLVPADCTSQNGDAKGLLEVGTNRLKFYESAARLGTVAAMAKDRIRATFAFTGEGQEWTQDVELRLWDGGSKLIRQDRGPDAQPGALTYTRCPAP